MIVKNIAEGKQFVPFINLTVANERLVDFFRRSQQWLVEKIIGTDLEALLEAAVPANTTDSHADLRVHCRRVITEKALLDAVPEMDVQLTEAGFAVQQNDNFVPASSQRVDRLIGQLQTNLKTDTDALVKYLMAKSTGTEAYTSWRGTEQFTRLTQAFMPFTEYYWMLEPEHEPASYDQFYASLPRMARGMRVVGDYYVSIAEIDRLLEMYRDNDLLEIHKRAIRELRVVAMASGSGNMERARAAAARARDVMLTQPDSFPQFKASSAYTTSGINLDAGRTVNFT